MKYLKLLVITGVATLGLAHAELVHQFKNPAFSGIGFSSHVLTIESIEKNRRDQLAGEERAKQDRLSAEANNTPLARFMSLFQSQVYAQLSTQLSNNLFQNRCTASDGSAIPGCVNPSTGNFKLDGNTVTWEKSSSSVKLTVVDVAGTVTVVTVPIASFAF
jgi:hypothetical protein